MGQEREGERMIKSILFWALIIYLWVALMPHPPLCGNPNFNQSKFYGVSVNCDKGK